MMLTSVKWKIIMVRQNTNKITDSKTVCVNSQWRKDEKTIAKPEDSGKLDVGMVIDFLNCSILNYNYIGINLYI